MSLFYSDVKRAHHQAKRLQVFPTLYGPSMDYRPSREIEVTLSIHWIAEDRRRNYGGLLLSTKRRRRQLERLGIL